VSFGPALSSPADLAREMPEDPTERLDRVQVALSTLRDESRRLERLGFEQPQARCHVQRRYWEFLGALFSLEEREGR
jgi:hypothetical protein